MTSTIAPARRRRTRLHRIRSGLIAMALVASASAPASAAGIFDGTDPQGDVKIGNGKGLSTAERNTIDLRRFTVTQNGSKYRLGIKIKRIYLGKKFEQDLQISMKRLNADSATFGGYFYDLRSGKGYASWYDSTGDEGAECGNLPLTINAPKGKVSMDVPQKCIVPGDLRIRVFATAYRDNGEDKASTLYSSDKATYKPVTLRAAG